ncbi:MAG: methyltransferase, TIGR04325 family [Pseudomonadota bacterium]
MFKKLLQQITPPILFSVARRTLRWVRPVRPSYEGFFHRREQLPPVSENPFEHANWLSYVSERAESLREPSALQNMHEMCLSLIASIVPLAASASRTAVIDFGGGVGMYWPMVRRQNKAGATHEFIVVDSPSNCELGRSIFGNDGVRFFADFEQALATGMEISVLNVSSTLQYCLDYEAIVELLCTSRANFIVISRHPAQGDGLPVAYTMQNVQTVKGVCGRIPVVLIGVDRLKELLRLQGYMLIADYYGQADANKYWSDKQHTVPAGFAHIVEHALVFQRVATAVIHPTLPPAVHAQE